MLRRGDEESWLGQQPCELRRAWPSEGMVRCSEDMVNVFSLFFCVFGYRNGSGLAFLAACNIEEVP